MADAGVGRMPPSYNRCVHPDVEELRPKLKEVLYDCAVEIKATKAALYLYDGSSRFELAADYGFRGGIRRVADMNDPVVDRCGRGRNAFFINGLAAEPRFSEILFEASTDRMLVAPLYLRGQLVGLIDMRDKAAKQPFEKTDVPKAMAIAAKISDLFANKNVFGKQFIALSEAPESAQAPVTPSAAPPDPPPIVTPPAPVAAPPVVTAPHARRVAESAPVAVVPPPVREHVPRLATLVIEARTAADRIVIAPQPESLSEAEVAAAGEALRSVLLIPGTVAAAFSAFGHLGGVQEIAAKATLSDEARNLIQSKLNVWLTKRGDAAGYVRTSISTPFGSGGPPILPADVQKVFTAPLSVGSLRGLYLTVAFAGNPDRVAHELLAALHAHLQLVIEQSMQRAAHASLRGRIAEKLVEPDFTRFPELRAHSMKVSMIAEAFAQYLMLDASEIESARIVGLVHDVGMRLLDYDRLYRKKDLSPEEVAFLREHPAVGAAMVEPLLGREIARAVLCHHERFDGRGYPNELQGNDIPFVARIVQICDAWVAMTDLESYQPAESPEAAMTVISRAAGSQFDGELTARFVEMVRR